MIKIINITFLNLKSRLDRIVIKKKTTETKRNHKTLGCQILPESHQLMLIKLSGFTYKCTISCGFQLLSLKLMIRTYFGGGDISVFNIQQKRNIDLFIYNITK